VVLEAVPVQCSRRVAHALPWNTTSTLGAATNAEYFYDYADQDPVDNYDLDGTYKARGAYGDGTCSKGYALVDLACTARGHGRFSLSYFKARIRGLSEEQKEELLQVWNGVFADKVLSRPDIDTLELKFEVGLPPRMTGLTQPGSYHERSHLPRRYGT
jgi:hypothetical protein